MTFHRTPDEDFGILLEAAVMYDRRVSAILGEDNSTEEEAVWNEMWSGKQYLYPRLLFVITGDFFGCIFRKSYPFWLLAHTPSCVMYTITKGFHTARR